MSESRLDAMRAIVDKMPDDPRPRYFLAHELFKLGAFAEAAEQYRRYVEAAPGDEGAAYKNLGLCFERLGRIPEAAEAYRKGIAASHAHGHASLASEIEFLLDEIESGS